MDDVPCLLFDMTLQKMTPRKLIWPHRSAGAEGSEMRESVQANLSRISLLYGTMAATGVLTEALGSKPAS